MKTLRYLIPNALTACGILMAARSIQVALEGNLRVAAWWVLCTVLTDKLDGIAARALRASSEFGAQLDSFSDFFSFGIAPSAIVYAFFSRTPGLGWQSGTAHLGLTALWG